MANMGRQNLGLEDIGGDKLSRVLLDFGYGRLNETIPVRIARLSNSVDSFARRFGVLAERSNFFNETKRYERV